MDFILNGQPVTTQNILQISLNSDFTQRVGTLEIGADRLIFEREGKVIIDEWKALYGPFHGIPLDILTANNTLRYYVDLMEDAVYREFSTEVTIKRRGGKDNFFDQAEGTSWELMKAKGVDFTIFDIPYKIVKPDAFTLALILGSSIFTLTRELINQIIALSEAVTNVIDAVTPDTGTAITFNIGQITTLVIKALLQLIVVGLLIFALLKMAQQFFELIWPQTRYFQGCKELELMQKGCEFLGYTFESDLMSTMTGATVLPVPLVKSKNSWWDYIENDLNFAYTKGYPTAQDTVPTIGALFSALEAKYNARTVVVDNVVRFERRDYYQTMAATQVIPALNLQDKRDNALSLNTQDVWKRKYVHYQVDASDLHTMDFFDPTDAEYSTEPTVIPNVDLVAIKGYQDVNLPFALGVRKNQLNFIENLAKEFFELVDNLSAQLGAPTNYVGIINNSIGVMQISQQFFSVTKSMWTVNGKQPANYMDHLSASSIYSQFHQIDEIEVNDYEIFIDSPVRMNEDDFISLMNVNYAEIDGLPCEILAIQFFEEQSHAIISYKKPNNWANGKTQVLTINS